jgi:hypothetical protein
MQKTCIKLNAVIIQRLSKPSNGFSIGLQAWSPAVHKTNFFDILDQPGHLS